MKKRSIFVFGALALCVVAILLLWLTHPKTVREPITEAKQAITGRAEGASTSTTPKLVVQYASPPPHIAPVVPDPTPVPALAIITRGEKSLSPKFYSGHSQRLRVQLNEAIPVQVSWAEDTTHSDVFVQAIQGGKIDGGGNSKRFSLTDAKTINFNFTPTTGVGMYQVILRRGTVEESLEFWVPTGHPENEPPTI